MSAPHIDPATERRLRRAHLADRIARRVISIGGVGVLGAVIAIFAFVAWEALPLLRPSDVAPGAAAPMKAVAPVLALASDEYREALAVIRADGVVAVRDAATGAARREEPLLEEGAVPLRSACVTGHRPVILGGAADGRLGVALLSTTTTYADATGTRSVDLGFERFDPVDVLDGRPVTLVAGVVAGDEDLVAVAGDAGELQLVRARLGMGRARVVPLEGLDAGAHVTSVAVASFGDSFRVYAGLADGRVLRWDATWRAAPQLFESVKGADVAVTALTVLLGEETLVVGDADGHLSAWFGVRASPDAPGWNMTHIRDFPPLARSVARIAPATRHRGFLAVDAAGDGGLYHGTTGRELAPLPALGAAASALTFAPKSDGFFAATDGGALASFDIHAPHPETSASALFLPVWYEGATEPLLRWQSTGGSDDFEPKLSLTTLVFGSLKGVLYSLLFSIPLAIAAAIYTSLFLPAGLRAIVKPAVEIMAALPSVVIGLLAALWLSGVVERNLTSFFVATPAFLASFLGLVAIWRALPRRLQIRASTGVGLLIVTVPAIALTVLIARVLGPVVEDLLLGGDVHAWLRNSAGLPYDPRNALVVGFAMGFAVVPVIFTIAEDAISNVPKSLWAASEALGASRWQTTWRVVLPAAAPGVFAALMLGFGRAIGETMIVLMATGNTPILDLSPFNGMRTISACIAVEIPEAPLGGTLYRVLFLAGALLFLFTFLCNTVAEVVGHRLRQKYGRF